MDEFEKILGYEFKNKALLKNALTHSSYANEHKIPSNERLEFLGDAVLELASTKYLYDSFPDIPEGRLTKMRASFVCERALSDVAKSMGLPKYILLGKGEEVSGGRQRPSVVSDAFEAVLGAVYLDGGFADAKDLVVRHILKDLTKQFFFDSKTVLQEEAQGRGLPDPEYKLVKESGPDHAKEYEVEVLLGDGTKGIGKGTSKKVAAQEAALEVLKKLGKV